MARLALAGPLSVLGGRGLCLGSMRFAVDDAGVAWFEPVGVWAGPEALLAEDGDVDGALETGASLFFLDPLFDSFARESCSC